MKLKSLTLCGLLFSLLLTGCGSNTSTSIEQGNKYDDTISFEPIPEFESFWGNATVERDIEASIRFDIPYFKAPSYSTSVSYDDVGDPLLELYFLGFEENEVDKKRDEYVNICKGAGYQIQFDKLPDGNGGTTDVYYLQKTINHEEYIQVTVLSGRQGPTAPYCFGAFCTRFYTVYPNEFPNNILRHYFGYEIPWMRNEKLKYTCHIEPYGDHGDVAAYIEMVFATEADEGLYLGILEKRGYSINDKEYDEYGYFCTSYASTHMIQFKWTDDFGGLNKQAICIWTWPLKDK